MNEFGLWWIGVGLFVVGFIVTACIDNDKKIMEELTKYCPGTILTEKVKYSFGWFLWGIDCLVVAGIDIICAMWAMAKGGVEGWYSATVGLSILVGLIALYGSFDNNIAQKKAALNQAKVDRNTYTRAKLMTADACKKTHELASTLQSSSYADIEELRNKLNDIKNDRQHAVKVAKRVADINKKFARIVFWRVVITIVVIGAIVGTCVWMNVCKVPQIKLMESATYTLTDDGNYVVSGRNSWATDVVIQSKYKGKDVVGIANEAFANRASLTNITIPDSVTSIGDRAFYCCLDLTSIAIPDSVTTIGYDAFAHCKDLTNVTVPCGIAKIPMGAFRDCGNLKSITYKGTKQQWLNNVEKGSDWYPNDSLTVVCTDGTLDVNGNEV